eukprot:3812429-Pleurochrysis_carterae.AAC.1
MRRLRPEHRAQPGHQIPRHRHRRVRLTPRFLAQRPPCSPPCLLPRLELPSDVSRAAGRSETLRLPAGRRISLLLLPPHGAASLAPARSGSTA